MQSLPRKWFDQSEPKRALRQSDVKGSQGCLTFIGRLSSRSLTLLSLIHLDMFFCLQTFDLVFCQGFSQSKKNSSQPLSSDELLLSACDISSK